MRTTLQLHLILFLFLAGSAAHAARFVKGNTDESKVLPYTLPEVLTSADGTLVRDTTTWRSQRRAEILHAFSINVYGRTPTLATKLRFEVTATEPRALDGLATHK